MCKEEIPRRKEVKQMALKHKVCINVTAPNGRKRMVLQSGVRNLPVRLIRFLFGDCTQVVVLKPGQSVDAVEVKEIPEEMANTV